MDRNSLEWLPRTQCRKDWKIYFSLLSGLKLRPASPGLRAFSVMWGAWQRSRRIPALLGYFHRIARLNMQLRWKTRKRRLQPFVLFDDKSYTRKVHPLWIPQTSRWFLSTYREGALPALLQGVSLIKATILEKQKVDTMETPLAPLTASQCIGVFTFLTTLTWATSYRHRCNLVAPSQLHCKAATRRRMVPTWVKRRRRRSGYGTRGQTGDWFPAEPSGILHTTPAAVKTPNLTHYTNTCRGLKRLRTEHWNFTLLH